MADSIDKKNEDSSEDFADDLDAMLNHVESSLDESEELIEDEDAIDQLLMDNAFDMAAEGADDEVFDSILDEGGINKKGEVAESVGTSNEAEDELDEFEDENDFSNTVSSKKDEADEFGEFDEFEFEGRVSLEDDQQQATASKNKGEEAVDDEDEFNVENIMSSAAVEPKSAAHAEAEDLISSILENAVAEKSQVEEESEEVEDEFDVDDLIASEAQSQEDKAETAVETKVEPEPEDELENDDFLMADFDISADDDELLDTDEEEGAETVDSSEDIEAVSGQDDELEAEQQVGEGKVDSAELAELKKKLDAQGVVVEQTTQDMTQFKSALDELNAQMAQLKADNEALKTQITALIATTTEKDESASEEIDTLQKDQRKLKKVVQENAKKVPVIVYVVMAIAILALLLGGGLGAVGYGAQTEVESLTELVSTIEEEVDINSAKDSSAAVRQLNLKITELQDKDRGVSSQLNVVNKKLDQPNPLQAVVDDLVEQNDHAQVAIENLLAIVGTLEQQQKVVVTSKKKVKKVRKAVVKVEWIVHLVSFKQEWYAKRKAEEFEKKGILAKVGLVKVNGETWFRLSVKGFKTKYEAAAYAVKVKKTLNLTSVWVAKS
mgnify:FL=1